MDYKELLEKARKESPMVVKQTERFEIPKVKGHLQGNKTVLSNFFHIADVLQREPQHLLKYVLKELATPGEMQKQLVILGRKISASCVNEKIEQYVREFVLCKECGKSDTKIIKEDEFAFLRCTACGARQPIKSKI